VAGDVGDDVLHFGVAQRLAVDLAPHGFEAGRRAGLLDLYLGAFGQAEPAKSLFAQPDFVVLKEVPVIDQRQGGENLGVVREDPDRAQGLELFGRISWVHSGPRGKDG